MQQLHKLRNLKTYVLQAQGDEIGKINEIYFEDENWLVRYFVVHTGGWLLGRDVLIAPRLITSTRLSENSRLISTNLTREQVDKSPVVDTKKPVSRHYEDEYYRYYGWEPYWGEIIPPDDPALLDTISQLESIKAPEHPHLRASNEVQGYRIHTIDGELGEVYDFILEDDSWKIQYLVLKTSKWLLGKKVLVATAWVVSVDWAEQKIKVKLNREIIQSAPPYDPSQLIDRDYEVKLFKHYGKAIHAEGNSSSNY